MDFFRIGMIKVDQDQWALAVLIQWIWRGSIRNGEIIFETVNKLLGNFIRTTHPCTFLQYRCPL